MGYSLGADTDNSYNVKELKLAMKIGHHYDLASISARDWDRVGATGGIESPRERVRTMVVQLPERVEAILKEFKSRGLAAKVMRAGQSRTSKRRSGI